MTGRPRRRWAGLLVLGVMGWGEVVGAAPAPRSDAEPSSAPAAPAAAPDPPADAADDADDWDLSRYTADVSEFTEHQGVKLYGFADFTYRRLLVRKDSEWRDVLFRHPSFAVGNLNLYFSSRLSHSWRSLIEVRLMYIPNGTERREADGQLSRFSTRVGDYNDFGRPLRWGGIEIERAWLEYGPAEYLNIVAGQWLTPYGIWNVDHGSPAIIAVNRPFIIGEQLFPERQTGLQLHGKAFIGSSTVGYHATISNGRGTADSHLDFDANKAIGGRLYLRAPAAGELEVGASWYAGKFTDATETPTVVQTPAGLEYDERVTRRSFDELSYGLDVKWTSGGFHWQGEFLVNDVRFEEGHRTPSTQPGAPPGFVADHRRLGAYTLLGYRTELVGLMPYTLLEYYNFGGSGEGPPAYGAAWGVNARPDPGVVLKLQYMTAIFPSAGNDYYLVHDPLRLFEAQVAWVF